MKRTVLCSLTFTTIIVFGMFEHSLPTTEQAAPTKSKSASEKPGRSRDSGPSSLATPTVNPLRIDPKQPSRKYTTNSSLFYAREKVEVVARSVTFPHVIKQGEYMLSGEFLNAGTLCLNVTFYAGKVQGLIFAMDRDIVMEERLFWIIDAADDLYYACSTNLLPQAFAGQNGNDRNQLKDIKEELTGQIQGIQKALKYAQTVKIKAAEPFCR